MKYLKVKLSLIKLKTMRHKEKISLWGINWRQTTASKFKVISRILKCIEYCWKYWTFCIFKNKNPALNLKTKKSFASTWKEYYLEYRDFSLQMLKSLFIEKDYKQFESKETLIQKWKQWKRICTISFSFSKESFPIIEFKSEKKNHKKVDYDSINEIIENAWKVLISKGRNFKYTFNSYHVCTWIKNKRSKIFKIWGCI